MKKLLPTFLLVAVCIAGFWYASSQSMFKPKAETESKQLLNLPAADVQTFRIRDGADTTELSRNNGAWEMSKPQPLPLDKLSAESWAESFAKIDFAEKIVDNPADLGEYGLDQPSREFEALLKDGSSKKLLAGKALHVAGSTYVKLADSPAVYALSDETLQSLLKKPLDFMEKQPIALEYDKVKHVKLSWKGAAWLLDKKDPAKKAYESEWTLGSKALKPEEGAAILDQLVGLATDRLAKPAAESKTDKPDLAIEAVQEDNGTTSTVTYTGKIENDGVWINKQNDVWAYALPIAKVEEIADKGK